MEDARRDLENLRRILKSSMVTETEAKTLQHLLDAASQALDEAKPVTAKNP